jgi:hypothetical protein
MLNRHSIDLFMAVRANHFDAIRQLVRSGVDLSDKNKDGATIMHYASDLGHWEAVALIAEENPLTHYGSNSGSYGYAVLKAVMNNQIETAETLLKAGAPVNLSRDNAGNGCLHWAVKNKNSEMIALLLTYGAEIQQTNKENKNAIELADALNLSNYINEGWVLYYSHQMLKKQLPLLAQEMINPNSYFSRLPREVLNIVLKFSGGLPSEIKGMSNLMTETAARSFIQSYSTGLFHNRSTLSKNLILALKEALDLKSDNARIAEIQKKINNFLHERFHTRQTGKYIKSNALNLLLEFKLVNSQMVERNPQETNQFRLK